MTDEIILGTESKFIKDSDTRMVCLNTNVSTGSSPLSYHEGNGNYQIPVGKVFVPIRIHAANSSTNNDPFELWYNTTVDNTGGSAILWAKFRNTSEGIINFTLGCPRIPATNYVTLRNSTAGNIYSTMVGVETNA